MWVYQEKNSSTNALVPAQTESRSFALTEEDTRKNAEAAGEISLKGSPADFSVHSSRRKFFYASRSCILLAAAYLFGTFMAGVLQALCDAKEAEALAYYLNCWRNIFSASGPSQVVGLFGAEFVVVIGAAACFLLLGLSAIGPLPIFFFAMLYGTGSGLLSIQLLTGLGWKQRALFLLTASLPTSLAAGALCLFGTSALEVSSRLHTFSFRRAGKGSGTLRPAGAGLLVGQFVLLSVLLCPLCGVATGLVYLTNRLIQPG